MQLFKRLKQFRQRLSLGWKIYLSLAAIVLPVFALTIFVQSKMIRPLLEEEVRQVGLSVSRALTSDIVALRLINKPANLEARLIEMSWLQPSVVRLDVFTREGEKFKRIASNIVDETNEEGVPETPPLPNVDLHADAPQTELKKEENSRYWDIVYPIRDNRRTLGFVHAQVSLQLVNQVVSTFTKTALLGNVLAIGLLMLLLSYYLRRMIETESENVQLTKELHETQRQLFLNEKLAVMGQLTASFAHEIGTPLNSLSGHLQLLKDEVADAQAQARLDIINSQVTRIEGIVRDFLASTHTPPQQKQLVDVPALIDRITKLVAPRVASIHANVSVKVEPQLEPIRAVPTDLEQVLLNLTNNAIDALEHGASTRELTFEARRQNHEGRPNLEIVVRDTGDGIAPDALKQVLKPFFTTKAPGQGTGLGLTISQRLIKRYGGRLELESALGKGTSIRVSIPYDAT